MLGGRTVRSRGMLVVAEVALAVVLLTGAGLLMTETATKMPSAQRRKAGRLPIGGAGEATSH